MDPQDSNTTLVSSNHFTSSSSSSTTEQYFNIEVECKIFYAMNGVTIEGVTDTVEGGITIVPKEDIERFIYMVFCYFDVPEDAQARMAAKILRYAQEIVNEAPKNQQILDMHLVLAHTKELHNYDDDEHYYAIDDYYGEAVEESMNENEDVRIIPASESSIKGLEKVNLEEKEGNGKGIKCSCAICFEVFSVDSDETVRMPCFHLFHKKCITIWLRNRNSCPLCRFQMPTEEDDE